MQVVPFLSNHWDRELGRKALSNRKKLAEQIAQCPSGTVFYHFVDALRRTPDGRDDFSFWLGGCGFTEEDLRPLTRLDPYLFTLRELRDRLAEHIGTLGRDHG